MESLIADFGENLLLTSFLTTNIAEIRMSLYTEQSLVYWSMTLPVIVAGKGT